ncbi:MAG: glycoside hydrolase family 97 protein [Bacteroidales bacterium]|jgi:alpha-glucosidase|nr:glycoside hydrolase family 97 protein [Bacteroidales bacterium]
MAQKPVELLSPDGTIQLSITLGDKISYNISNNGEILLQNNELQLQLRKETLGKAPKLASQKRTSVDTNISPVVSFKFSTIKNKYNQLLLNFKGDYSVEFRAFDDGVAYRFITRKKGEIEVMHEDVNLSFPSDYLLHVQQDDFNSYYESPYKHLASREFNPDDQTIVLPVLVDTRKGAKILISEADLNDYPCLFFHGRGGDNGLTSAFPRSPLELKADANGRNIRVSKEADYIAKTAGTREFPWRWFVIAKNDGQLVESTMVARLSPQNVLGDVSWIKPGQVMWDWMNRWSDYGPEVNYTAGVNTAAYKHYIDFASRNKIPYLVIDAGWSKDNAAPMEVQESVDMPELVRYGREKQVGLILWITYRGIQDDFNDNSINLFEHFSKMGIVGFKIDFMDRNDQSIVNFYEQAAKEAAKYKMLVELHGSYKPVGLEYRYPNVLSYEGVMGLENGIGCLPDNSVYLPFMRNVLGPMSFTPGSMLNVQPENAGRGLGSNLVTVGTRVHHMAHYVLFESGLQMIADSPRQFDQNPDCRDFIFSTPVTWDETHALAAQAGKYIISARRHGNKWWIGGITNNDEKIREFDLTLDFLPAGKTFRLTAFEDGINANHQAMDYDVRKLNVKQGDKIHVKLARNGGVAAVIELL